VTSAVTTEDLVLLREWRRRKAEYAPTPPTLAAFVEQTTALGMEPWQRIICERLERLLSERGARVLVHGPPQFGKSLVISQRFPAYALGRAPLLRVRTACYNISHAARFTKVNLELMRDPSYAAHFPGVAVPALAPADEWSTTARAALRDANPSVKALGLGTGFTGLGVDVLIVDDPYKNAQEARSAAVNLALRDWWQQVVIPRLNPDANVVVMFHRWWEGDFAGWLIEQGGWEVLRFPALADGGPDDPTGRAVGEPLSPRFTREYLAAQRAAMGTAFEALYQGTPYPAEGTMFKPGGVVFVDAPPRGATFVRGWDIGATADAGDPTASALLYRTPTGRYGVAHARKGQWGTDQRDAIIRETATLDQATYGHVTQDLPQDPGAAGKSQAAAFVRLLAGFPVYTSTESGDKATRADPLSSQWNAGNVEIVRGTWNREYLDDMCAFPQGKHDHYTDASSRAFNRLAGPSGWNPADLAALSRKKPI
jgi:predicted phage terminase large subunit-like protein